MTQTTNDPLARDWGQFIDGEMSHGSGDALVVDNPYSEKAAVSYTHLTLPTIYSV